MGELELVARVDNRLLLRDEQGVEYRLPICPKLKSAVYSAQASPVYATVTAQTAVVPVASEAKGAASATGKHAKLSVLKPSSSVPDGAAETLPDGEPQPRLRPAELQIRLRAGDTPEQLSRYSDLTAAQIARFAGPIEAERADIIRMMQRIQVASSAETGTGGSRVIGDLVNQRLSARGITSEQITWFARRDLGAPWLIELKFEDGARAHSARWTFEPRRNQLTALDDEARWLSSGEACTHDSMPISLHQAKRPSPVRGTRPVSAFDQVDGPQVSGAPIALPRKPKPVDEAPEPAPERPDLRPVAGLQTDSITVKPRPAKKEAEVAGIVPLDRWQAGKLDTVAMPVATPVATAEKAPVQPAPADVLFESTATGSTPAVGRKGGRSKIPSWDEIVFGGKE